MTSIFKPTLYSKGRKGETRFWNVSTSGDNIIVEHGVLGGATQRSSRLAFPKNVGRSNETTGQDQAQIEAEALWVHKRDRKYSLTIEDAQEDLALPMLALDLEKIIGKKGPKQKNPDILFPADLQRKLDGNRAKARWNDEGTEVILESRGGKLWLTVPHINKALEAILPKGDELDGELYYHGWSLQKISSRTKKVHPDTHLLQYHIYDRPVTNGNDGLPWSERVKTMYDLGSQFGLGNCLVFEPTYTVDSYAEAVKLHDKWVQEGYEGAIIRLFMGKYEFGIRSRSLIKLKVFTDEEFQIIGTKSEDITRLGEKDEVIASFKSVVWECKNNLNDLTFETRPKGTYADRHQLFIEAQKGKHIGEMLTVRFFMRTEDGLPFLPIGHAIRPSEDMD